MSKGFQLDKKHDNSDVSDEATLNPTGDCNRKRNWNQISGTEILIPRNLNGSFIMWDVSLKQTKRSPVAEASRRPLPDKRKSN